MPKHISKEYSQPESLFIATPDDYQLLVAELSVMREDIALLRESVAELQAFRTEWEPVLITLAQSLVAFARSPMGSMMPLPPQVQVLLTQLTVE